MKKYILEVTAFVSGAVVMILELDGARIIAPYLGTSTIVWTSLIGVILGSLSFGYWYGGKRADRNADFAALGKLLAIAATLTLSIAYLKVFLELAALTPVNLIIRTIIGTILLFAPATICLGMVTPYVVRLKMKTIETSGRTIGTLYALSTLGSIIGTFLGGFFLISYFGSTKILLALSSALFFLAAFSFWNVKRTEIKKWAIGLVVIAFIVPWLTPPSDFGKTIIKDIDTRYSRVWIYDGVDEATHRPVRYMTDSIYGIQGASFLDDPSELAFEYGTFFDHAAELYPGFTKALMIGAGVYSYPKHFISVYPEATLDVVEIDPKLVELAEKYFSFKGDPRINVIHEDGRIFLNRNKTIYNVIFNDAFLSYGNIPFQLTTTEAVGRMYDALDAKGVVITNLVSAISGQGSEFLQAEYATYKKIFPVVYAVRVLNLPNTDRQNVILMAMKSPMAPVPDSKNVFIPQLNSDIPILTDEFAPVERYITQLLLSER